MVAPLVGAAAIGAGSQLFGGLFGKDPNKAMIKEGQRQEFLRANEFARGVGGFRGFGDRFTGLGEEFLGRGREGLDRARGGYESLLDDQAFEDKISSIQDETSLAFRGALPDIFASGGKAGFSPFGGRTQRTLGGVARGLGERADIAKRGAAFENRNFRAGVFDRIQGLGQFETGAGFGSLGSGASVEESIFGARLNTPGASGAEREFASQTGAFAPGASRGAGMFAPLRNRIRNRNAVGGGGGGGGRFLRPRTNRGA